MGWDEEGGKMIRWVLGVYGLDWLASSFGLFGGQKKDEKKEGKLLKEERTSFAPHLILSIHLSLRPALSQTGAICMLLTVILFWVFGRFALAWLGLGWGIRTHWAKGVQVRLKHTYGVWAAFGFVIWIWLHHQLVTL